MYYIDKSSVPIMLQEIHLAQTKQWWRSSVKEDYSIWPYFSLHFSISLLLLLQRKTVEGKRDLLLLLVQLQNLNEEWPEIIVSMYTEELFSLKLNIMYELLCCNNITDSQSYETVLHQSFSPTHKWQRSTYWLNCSVSYPTGACRFSRQVELHKGQTCRDGSCLN